MNERLITDALYEGGDRATIRRRELAFLTHLAGRGMTVQTPVANQQGEFLTLLPGGICATLLTWLPGRTPAEEDVANGVYFRAGAVIPSSRWRKASG